MTRPEASDHSPSRPLDATQLAGRPAAGRPAPRDPIADPGNPVSAWNVANGLTSMRLLLVPVFALLLFAHGGHQDAWRIAACIVFAVASLTDQLDGEIARRRGLVTEFGKLADPIADKALIGTALVGLSLLGDLPWWITVVVLTREVGVTLLRFWVIRHGVLAASRGGKVKTTLETIAIGLYVLPLDGPAYTVAVVVMVAAVILAVITGADYVARALRLRRGTRVRR